MAVEPRRLVTIPPSELPQTAGSQALLEDCSASEMDGLRYLSSCLRVDDEYKTVMTVGPELSPPNGVWKRDVVIDSCASR